MADAGIGSNGSRLAPANAFFAVTDSSNHGTSCDTPNVPPQTHVFRGAADAALVTSQGSLDNEQVSFPMITDKKAPGGRTNPESHHVANRKHGATVAKHHEQANKPDDLVLPTDIIERFPGNVELQSMMRGAVVRYKTNANRKPSSTAPLPPGLRETKVTPPALSDLSTSHQHSDTSICQHGNQASREAHEDSTGDATHGRDANGVAAGQLDERQPSAQGTRLLGNYPVESSAERARLSGQLRQEAQAGPSTQEPQLWRHLSSYLSTNSNGNGHRSVATTAVPPAPTAVPSVSRPTKRPKLTHRTELPALPENHILRPQDPVGSGLFGFSGPLQQATQLGQSQQFQHSLQAQKAPQSQQPQQPQQPQQTQQAQKPQQLQQLRQLHQSQELQRSQQPRQPERHGPAGQPQQPRHSEPSRAPGALPREPSQHPGQNRIGILYPGERLKGPVEENTHFEAAFSEFLVAEAFDSGAARHTFEEYHTTSRYVAELEYRYRHRLAACHPKEREHYLRGLASRRDPKTHNNNRNGVSSRGDDNGGPSGDTDNGGPSVA